MDIKKADSETIEKILKNRMPGPEGIHNRFAVLALLFDTDEGLSVLFEKRALTLNHQPGEISLPGGRSEPGEAPLETALRETSEELGIPRKHIQILGQTDFVVTFYNTVIFPFVGYCRGISLNDIEYSKDEVDCVFTVPLSFFVESVPQKKHLSFKMSIPEDFPYDLIPNGRNYKWGSPRKYRELFFEYKGQVIWGLTARIIAHICELITEC